MFRFAQQSQIIKGRLPNQFVSASTRNSLNHSIRFNTTVSIERQDGAPNSTNTVLNGNKAAAAAERVRHLKNQFNSTGTSSSALKNNYKNVKRFNKNLNDRVTRISSDSPWFHQLSAFDECVSQTLYLSQTPMRKGKESPKHPDPNSNPLFWESINKSMQLYNDLVEQNVPELDSFRVSRLVHLLHNGLRANRNQLTRMNKKPDYDSQSFHKEMTNYLCQSLRSISQHTLSGKVFLNEYGAMHLVTAFKELLLHEEAVQIWKSAISEEMDEKTSNVFLNPRVVGVVLPILYDNGVPYEEIQTLYEKSSLMLKYLHPNLAVGMIKASLSAGQNEMALNLFQQLCETITSSKQGYLVETHLSFVGECKDLNVAQTFFDKALNNEMPYKVDLQVSYVKSFLRNIWNETRDFKKVYDIWSKSSVHYGRDVNHGISSSLNDTFFELFFERYAEDKLTGFHELQNIIQVYNKIKPIDEPFFNIILTKCSIWRDREIIEYVDKAYELYHIPRTIVAYRILLKSMGSVDNMTTDEILQSWIRLVTKSESIGQAFIANADWAALRDATVTWSQYQLDNTGYSTSASPISLANSSSNLFSNNQNEVDLSHPALQAANASGAFDDFTQDDSANVNPEIDARVKLYLKIVKRYAGYCRDSRQLARLTTGTALKYSILKNSLPGFESLDVSDIPVPELYNLRGNN